MKYKIKYIVIVVFFLTIIGSLYFAFSKRNKNITINNSNNESIEEKISLAEIKENKRKQEKTGDFKNPKRRNFL